jgi:hypothetical protein
VQVDPGTQLAERSVGVDGHHPVILTQLREDRPDARRDDGFADPGRRGARSRAGVGCLSIVLSVAAWAGHGQRTSGTLPGVCNFTARPRRATTMRTDAHNMGREERRALLEQRRAEVTRQLRRLAIELTDIDRQLDEIEQSEP